MKKAAWFLAALAIAALALAGAAAWLVGTEPGARWVVERALEAGGGTLALQGASGTLGRGLAVDSLHYADGTVNLSVERLRLRPALGRIFAGQLAFERVAAESVRVQVAEQKDKGPSQLPGKLVLPFRLVVDELNIERLDIAAGGQEITLRDVAGAYEGGRDRHRVPRLHFDSPFGRVALRGEMESEAPFALQGSGSVLYEGGDYPVGAGFHLRGDANRIGAELTASIGHQAFGHGTVLVRPRAAQPLERLQLQASGIDLRRFNRALPSTALDVRLEGSTTENYPVAGQLSVSNRAAPAPSDSLPFKSASGRFSVDRQRAQVSLHPVQGMGVDFTVRLDQKALPFNAAIELAEFDPARLGAYPGGALSGSVAASGALRGPREWDVRWKLADSLLRGLPFASEGRARISDEHVTRLDARARVGKNRMEARGALGRKSEAVKWKLDAPRLEHLDPRIAGSLRAQGTVTGTLDSPQVAFSARGGRLSFPGGLSARSASAEGRLASLADAPLALELSASGVEAGSVALNRFSAALSGRRSAHEARFQARGPGFATRATARGGLRADNGWMGELLTLVNEGEYPLRLLRPVSVEVSDRGLSLGPVEATLGDGHLLIAQTDVRDGRIASRGEVSALPAAWLLALSGLADPVRSSLRLDGRWDVAASPRLTGEVWLRRAAGDVMLPGPSPLELGLQDASLHARFVDGELSLRLQAQSRFGTLAVHGDIAPASGGGLGFTPDSPLSMSASFKLADLKRLAAPLLKQGYADGRLAAELRASGTLGRPILHGSLTGEALRLDLPPYGVSLHDGQLRARLEGDALHVTHLSLRAGDGTLTASGVLPFAQAREARLQWRAGQLRLLNRPDLRLVFSGSGALRFAEGRLLLTGKVRAEHAYVELAQEHLPRLGDDVVIVGRKQPEERDIKLGEAAQIDMELDLGERFEVRGRGFEGELEGQVRLVGPREGELLAYGKVRAADATYRAYGRKLEVDPGTLIFDGPLDNPALQITAWRRNQAVEAGVQLTGTAQAPNARLVSKPSVSDGEKLSWLVLGRAPSEASGADLGLLQSAAGALLSKRDAVPITDRIARAAGLDEIALRGSGELSERVLALGKQLSDRLYVGFEQSLGATAMNLVKLDYALTQRLSVRLETGTRSGWGLFYRFSWD